MTFREARAEAWRRWGTGGTGPDDVVGTASRGRNAPRFTVIARKRGVGLTIGAVVAIGESDESWEAAFAAAHEPQRLTPA